MTHPPIPPNCPYFVCDVNTDCEQCRSLPNEECENAWHFKTCCESIIFYDEYESICCSHLEKKCRPIIAAVARCAWLDEAERLRHDKVWLSDPWDMRTGRARENAEAWREWGETK